MPPQTVQVKDSSSINTVLLIIVLLLLVGGGVWWYKTYRAAPANDTTGGLQINVGGSTNQESTPSDTPAAQ